MYIFWTMVLLLFKFIRGREEPYRALEPDQYLQHHAQGWKKLHRAEPDKVLKLTFALKQRNIDQLENLLLEVSDPDSRKYGQYISVGQITRMISPSQKSIETIKSWLVDNGVSEDNCDLTANRDFLICEVPCYIAERLLHGTIFSYFKHDKLKKLYIRSDALYHVPSYISEHVDFIGGVHRLPNANSIKTKSNDELPNDKSKNTNGIHVGVYPKILRQRYKLANSDVGSHPNNSQSVAAFLDQYFRNSDLAEFMYLFVGSDFAHRTSIDKVIGPNHGRARIEATLDTQYIMGLGANITTWFWSTGGRHETEEPFLQWLVNVGNTSIVPPVHSISYGEGEIILSKAYMNRVNVEFMKLGLRGVTILSSSGDDGAGCVNKTKFSPHFPASSPYVTAVGGTRFYNPFTVGIELAYEISGGGFSNTFKRPKYQSSVVASFLNSTKVPPQRYFNKEGRAYPDISALCRHFWVVINRIPMPGVMGTSASTPTVAGIISMLNERRLQNNKPPMGFLNPFLYKNPQALNDVTSGYNEGCLAHDRGFYATKGYDTVTGNGTPNFPELVKAAMKVFS